MSGANILPFASDEDRERYERSRSRRGRTAGDSQSQVAARELPHSLEAEEYLLSCCLLDGLDVLPRCMDARLRPESFYDPKHGIIFGRLLDMLGRQVPIDVSILAEELKTSRDLDKVGGYGFLTQISKILPTTAQAGYFIEKVRELAQLREIIRSATGLVEDAYGFSGDIDGFASTAESKFLEATSGCKRSLPDVMRWGELVGKEPRPMPEELVKGLLYRGGKMMLGGGSKSFKTWVLLDLALSVATGKPWWGMATTATPVLFVNFELKIESFERRVRDVCKAKGIESAPLFHVWHLRGRARDFRELRVPLLSKLRRFKIGLGILDPIYKCLGERDENSNGEVGDLLNEVESVAVDGDCAMVHGHHFAKGDSSEKDKRDLTAGAGAWMRDPDSSVVLRPHEEEDCFTAEFILRDFEPRNPMVVRWRKPCMEWMPGADPSALRKAGRPKESGAEDVVKMLGDEKLSYSQWLRQAERRGMSESTFKRRVKEALAGGKVSQNGPLYFVLA